MRSSNKNLTAAGTDYVFTGKNRSGQKTRKRIVLILLYTVLLGYGAYQILFIQHAQISALRRHQQTLRENITEETRKNEALTEEYSLGNTDEVVEQIAREKLGLIMPDEKMYVDQSRN